MSLVNGLNKSYKKSMIGICAASAVLSTSCLMADNTIKLSEVTVTSAAGFEQKITDAPASISVITKEDLAKKSYTTLLDAVRDIEGVDVGETSDKSGQGTISIRGMGGDYTLVLIDGKKQNNVGDIYPNDFGGFAGNHIPPLDMIERIEVIRGPMSTLYGADAMGGVINIITKKISNEWRGSVTVSQTFQTDKAFGNDKTTDVSVSGPLIENKLGLGLRGSFYDKEKARPKYDVVKDLNGANHSRSSSGIGGGNGKTMDTQNWTAGARLSWLPTDNQEVVFDYDISRLKFDNTGGSTDGVGTVDSYETIWNNQRTGYAEYQRMERDQWSITHTGEFDIGKTTLGISYIESANLGRSLPLNATERDFIKTLLASYPKTNPLYDTYAEFYAALTASEKAEFDALLPRKTRTLESRQLTYDAKLEKALGNHFLVVGAQLIDAEMEDGVFGMTSATTTQSGVVQPHKQWALFAEDNYMATPDLTLTAGVRYDKHDKFGSNVSPRGYAVYALNPEWTLKGGVGTGYKAPKTSDLFDGIVGFGSQGTSPWIGNPDLKPEKSVNTELAAYFNHANGHSFNATVFQNKFKDKIQSTDVTTSLPPEWVALGYATYKQKQNVGNATIKGLELAGKYQISDTWSIKGNYTYTDSEITTGTNKGKPLTNSAKHMYNATLDWQATSKFNTYLAYSGEKKRYKQTTPANSVINKNMDIYYKDYSIVNLGASYKATKDITLNGRINNLLDKDFMKYDVVAHGTGSTRYYEDYSTKTAGRNYWLSMNVRF